MKVLIAVDGSPTTKHMLAKIGARQELLGTAPECTVLTVVTPVPGRAARFLDHEVVDGYYHDEAESVLAPVRIYAQQNGWTCETRYVVGAAAEQIARCAEDGHFDLIVMGTHGHGALGNMVLGSVANGVVARSSHPVLLVT